jgi:hypothetical protein
LVISEKENIKLCPYEIPGYLELIDNIWVLNGDIENGEHVICDNILSKVISKKGNVLKVINHNKSDVSYIIRDGDIFSHGETLKDAKESLVYKISNRDTSEYENWVLSDEKTRDELIRCYRIITGSCELGTRYFVENNILPDTCTIEKSIELTKGQYNNEKFMAFFNKE